MGGPLASLSMWVKARGVDRHEYRNPFHATGYFAAGDVRSDSYNVESASTLRDTRYHDRYT